MPSARLFEFEDLSFYPRVFRDATTLYLEAIERVVGLPAVFAPKLSALLKRTGARRLVDLGSGAGGPVRRTVALAEEELHEPVEVTLTDLRPNARAAAAIDALGQSKLRYLRDSVDATNPPPELAGVRSMFASFHHLEPGAARAVLASAFERREPICIFEITDPTPKGIAACAMMPLYVFLFTPFVRPLNVWQLVFTYAVPLLPLLIGWDGLVSTLRTYSVAELTEMTRELRDDGYDWEIGTIADPRLPLKFPYLIGSARAA